jgi:hypothetical protein
MIGERYRNLDLKTWKAEWIVEAIYKGTDHHEHAYLRSASDHTLCKTLALSVVSDPSRFVLVSTPAAVRPSIGPGSVLSVIAP